MDTYRGKEQTDEGIFHKVCEKIRQPTGDGRYILQGKKLY